MAADISLPSLTEDDPSLLSLSTDQPLISKSAQKRQLKLQWLKENRREKDRRKKEEKKMIPRSLVDDPDRVTKRLLIQQEKEHLKMSLTSFPKVIIDCAHTSCQKKR